MIKSFPGRSYPLALVAALLLALHGATPAQPPAPAASPAKSKDHWSFKPPVRPAMPEVKNASWVRNPIDAFIAAEHDKRGLAPRPEAP